MDENTFTFAELEFLLGASPEWPGVRQRLGFSAPEGVSDVTLAGLASLTMRSLATLSPDGARVRADVTDLVGRLVHQPRRVTAVLVERTRASSALFLASADGPVETVVLPLAPGVVHVVPIETQGADGAEYVADAVTSLLGGSEGGMSVAAEVAPGVMSQAMVAHDRESGWSIGHESVSHRSGAEITRAPATSDQVREHLRSFLTPVFHPADAA